MRINHHSLKSLLEQKVGTPAQQKWISKLLGHDFCIEESISLAAITFPTPTWLKELKIAYLGDLVVQQQLSLFQEGSYSDSYFTLK